MKPVLLIGCLSLLGNLSVGGIQAQTATTAPPSPSGKTITVNISAPMREGLLRLFQQANVPCVIAKNITGYLGLSSGLSFSQNGRAESFDTLLAFALNNHPQIICTIKNGVYYLTELEVPHGDGRMEQRVSPDGATVVYSSPAPGRTPGTAGVSQPPLLGGTVVVTTIKANKAVRVRATGMGSQLVLEEVGFDTPLVLGTMRFDVKSMTVEATENVIVYRDRAGRSLTVHLFHEEPLFRSPNAF